MLLQSSLQKKDAVEEIEEYQKVREIDPDNKFTLPMSKKIYKLAETSEDLQYREFIIVMKNGGESLFKYKWAGIDEILRRARPVVEGLAEMHKFMIHNDIKADNMLNDSKSDQFRLIDFGLSGDITSLKDTSSEIYYHWSVDYYIYPPEVRFYTDILNGTVFMDDPFEYKINWDVNFKYDVRELQMVNSLNLLSPKQDDLNTFINDTITELSERFGNFYEGEEMIQFYLMGLYKDASPFPDAEVYDPILTKSSTLFTRPDVFSLGLLFLDLLFKEDDQPYNLKKRKLDERKVHDIALAFPLPVKRLYTKMVSRMLELDPRKRLGMTGVSLYIKKMQELMQTLPEPDETTAKAMRLAARKMARQKFFFNARYPAQNVKAPRRKS